MNKSLVKLIVSILLLSFMGSVHSETERDKKERWLKESLQKIERSKSLVGKDYWFDLHGQYCSYNLVNKPLSSGRSQVEGEPIKGTIVEVVGDGSVEGEKFTDSEYTFFKIQLSDNRIVYMSINNLMGELDSLDLKTKGDMDSMMCVYPEKPDVYWDKVKQQRVSQKNKSLEKQKQQTKKPGVRIGMTKKQVINETSWGKPQSVNKTTNRYGTHEQWVYGGGNYLYFDNDELTSIQN